MLDDLGFTYVGRYVDDFYVIDTDKDKLVAAVPKIRELLGKYGLRLSPTKFYLQHYSKGLEFTGAVVKFDRIYTSNRTVKNFVSAIIRLNKAVTFQDVEHAVASINSYLGTLRHGNGYNIRRKVLRRIEPHCFKWIYIKGGYEIVAIKKQYQKRVITLRRIRDGTY